MVLKILTLGKFHFIWGVNTSLHAMNFYRNFSLTKVVLLPCYFLYLRNLACYCMSQTSKEIIISFRGAFLRLGFSKIFLADLKTSLGLVENVVFA